MSRPRRIKPPITALALLLLAIGLLIGTLIGQAIRPPATADVQPTHPGLTTTPLPGESVKVAPSSSILAAPLGWLCVNGLTYLVRGDQGIARTPEADAMCRPKK